MGLLRCHCGQEGTLFTQELLANVDGCVAQLVLLARVYGFDGWLLNFESALPKAAMPQLVSFVRPTMCRTSY